MEAYEGTGIVEAAGIIVLETVRRRKTYKWWFRTKVKGLELNSLKEFTRDSKSDVVDLKFEGSFFK